MTDPTGNSPNNNSSASAPISVSQQLARLISAINANYPQLTDPFDPDWRSPCETAEPQLSSTPSIPAIDNDHSADIASTDSASASGLEVPWQPLLRTDPGRLELFAPLERALEIRVHPDILTYYSSYYAGGLEADSPEGPVSLLQLWNDEDTTRLIENLLGHALAKQRAKAPYSVFFACTEISSDLFLAIENHTGHVLLERPGYKPERTIAGSLGEFLTGLVPAPPERHPERAAFLAAR